MLIRSLLFLMYTIMGASAFAQSGSLAQDDPYLLVERVAQNTFNRIQADKQLIEAQPEHIKAIIREELIPHIDYRFAAFKVLGKYFRTAPREELEEFVSVFRDYLVANYASALSFYDNQTVTFEQGTFDRSKRLVVVRARIQEAGKPDIKLSFKVRRGKKDPSWKAFDLVAEGISLIDSKRSEFGYVIRQGGIDQAIVRMRDVVNGQPDKPVVPQQASEE